MDLRAAGEGLGAHLARRADLEVNLRRGAQRFQHSIEPLLRPLQELAQSMDGHAVVVGLEALVGRLELPPEGVGLDESRALLVVVEPDAHGVADGGVACRWALSRGGTPVQITIEALEEVGGEADTDDPRIVRFSVGHTCSSTSFKNTTECSTWADCRGKNGVGQVGLFPGIIQPA